MMHFSGDSVLCLEVLTAAPIKKTKTLICSYVLVLGLICFRGFLSVNRVCTGSNRNKVRFLVIFWIDLILGISLFGE